MPDTTTKKSKWGLGGMLHKDRPTDSTYGSEGGTSSARDSYNAPSLTGSDNSAPTSTYTNSAGQTVTTTTTTTTTTTSGAGGQSETSGPHTSNMLNRLDPRVNSGSEETQTQEINQRREPPKSAPGIPSKSVRREPSPQPPPQQQQQSSRSSIPAILTGRSNRDRSPGYGDSPSSPSGRQNFSYPRQHGAPEPQGGQQTSTLQGLKTAAAGIHGAGETLRGTFNSSLDKHTGAPPERQAANERIVNSGRQEIEQGRLSDHSRTQGGVAPPKGILRKSGGQGQLRVVNE